MKVIIDDVRYVPQSVTPTEKHLAALAVEIETCDAGDNITVRDYLTRLLLKVWEEEECFNGKRPWGNSGWSHDLHTPLIKAGFIEGKVDEEGYAEANDYRLADAFVCDLIFAMCAA